MSIRTKNTDKFVRFSPQSSQMIQNTGAGTRSRTEDLLITNQSLFRKLLQIQALTHRLDRQKRALRQKLNRFLNRPDRTWNHAGTGRLLRPYSPIISLSIIYGFVLLTQ
jgi:hypothetical protein